MIKYVGIISLIIYSILVLILIINVKQKNKIIKYSFMSLLLVLGIVFLYFNQEIINQGLKSLIRYIYFPSFNSYLLTIFGVLCILIYSILSEKMYSKIRIVNYVFSSLLIVTYIVFMMLNVDIYSYNALYSDTSLICIRYTSRAVILWIIIVMSIQYYRVFFDKR